MIEYHRNPTEWEIKFGEGAIHYASFPLKRCLKKDGTLKKRMVVDGLVYTR